MDNKPDNNSTPQQPPSPPKASSNPLPPPVSSSSSALDTSKSSFVPTVPQTSSPTSNTTTPPAPPKATEDPLPSVDSKSSQLDKTTPPTTIGEQKASTNSDSMKPPLPSTAPQPSSQPTPAVPQPKQPEPPQSTVAGDSAVITSNASNSNNRSSKKIIFALLLLIVIALAGFGIYWFILGGSGGGASIALPWGQNNQNSPDGSNAGPITLTYWGLWESESVMQPIIDQYQQEHPNVTINYTQSSPTEYSIRLRNALEQGEGPDIFRMHNTWTYMLAPHLSSLPNNIYTPEEYQSTFWEIAYKNLTIQTETGTQIVAIPLMYDGLALFYNVDLLAEAGVSAPTDWISFQEVARAVTARDPETDQIVTAGAAMGSTQGIEHWSDIVGLLLYQNRANPAEPTSQLAADALTFYSLFSYRYNTWNQSWPSATEAFATGKLGMMFGPSWRVFDVQKIAQENGVNLNFEITEVPQLPDTQVTWANYWAEAVSNDSPNQQAAWEFLKYLSEAETMRQMIQLQTDQRQFGEIPSRRDLAAEFQSNPYMAPFITQAPDARTFPLTSGTTDQDEGINDRIIQYYSDAVDSAARGTAPSKVLPTVANGVQSVLKDYGLAN